MATINDVAQAAGVSISTVSYALTGKRPVAADTRRRIEDAVQRLNYRANAGARMLAGRKTHIFALTEPFRADTHAPTHMAFVLATSIAARRFDYDILLLTDEEATAGMRRIAASDLADAILVLDVAPNDERADLARALAVPSVFIGIPSQADDLVCVDLDFEGAAALAVATLADAGHERIALIGYSARAYETSNFPPRVRDGFTAEMARRGLTPEVRTPGVERSSNDDLRGAVAAVLEQGCTGLVLHCGEDSHAVVLDEIERHGLSVPGDLSIVTVGNTFDAARLPVPLDAVPLIPQQSCELAVGLAIRWVEDGGFEPGIHLIAPEYRRHGSVAAPASTQEEL